MPFSLDVSRASNRPSAEKDLSFLELAEKTANESPPDPAPETLERHLTSPPEADNTSPSLAPPSLAVKRSAADLWLAILVLVGLCAVAVWYFQVEFGLQEYLSFVPGPPRK